MSKEILKATIELADGTIKEFTGEGIVCIAVTNGKEQCDVSGGVIGKFGTCGIIGVARILQKGFGQKWMPANAMAGLEEVMGVEYGAVIAKECADDAAEETREQEE